jgi:hypothetical protein
MATKTILPSEFITIKGLEYFQFEEDFIEHNMRCIPMIVRFKMDVVGIKLKLSEWSKFDPSERVKLATYPTTTAVDLENYKDFLTHLIIFYTSNTPTAIAIEKHPAWNILDIVPSELHENSLEQGVFMTTAAWRRLTDLQRFTLLKLCRPGHENKNFRSAILEFGLL